MIFKSSHNFSSYLQGHLWVQLKLWHPVGPREEFFGFLVDVVIEYSSLAWEFDGLELSHPPFSELNPIIHKLQEERKKFKYREKILQGVPDMYTVAVMSVP